jgi:hypothetical protein
MKKIRPAEYERKCEDCGYIWVLNRHQAKFRARGRIPLLARRGHGAARITAGARSREFDGRAQPLCEVRR